MSQEAPRTPLLAALEARQDEVLKQLEDLNKQLEAALKQYAKTPREESPVERKVAA